MENLKILGISAVVAAVIMFSGHELTRPQATPAPVAGAVGSPDIPSPYFSYGGVRHWAASLSFRTASSTICAVQSPAATSTLAFATADVTAAPAYTQTYVIGESSAKNATTTPLANMTLASGSLGFIVATGTVTSLQDSIVPPLSWINFNISTSTSVGANQAIGRCYVGFREI